MKRAILYSTIMLGAVACCGQPKTTTTTQAIEDITNDVATDSVRSVLTGSYNSNRELKPEELELFRATMADIDGVSYTPEQVSTQIVAGTNYKFICSARTATLNPQSYKAVVVIYVPLPHTKQDPTITSITRID